MTGQRDFRKEDFGLEFAEVREYLAFYSGCFPKDIDSQFPEFPAAFFGGRQGPAEGNAKVLHLIRDIADAVLDRAVGISGVALQAEE